MTRFLTPHSAALPASVPFTGPETLERLQGQAFKARLGANESAFGPSPLALAALQKAAAEVWMYGEPENHDLKAALAQHHVCLPENIVVGPGIDNLLGLLCRLTLDADQVAVTSQGAYPTFNFHVEISGARRVAVPYKGDHEDPEALLAAAIKHKARLIYLANPDNPMGSHLKGEVIADMIARLPQETLLILDEAYIDLAPEEAQVKVALDHPQVIRFRTFSKAYGMAGARVGYGIAAPELALAFNKVRDHFGMCRISQAGALAALKDQDWLHHIRAEVAKARDRIGQIAQENGLRALPSATNFVTIDCGRDGDFARRILAECAKRGLFIRMPGVAPLDRCIRISLGPDALLDVVRDVLPQALAAARAG